MLNNLTNFFNIITNRMIKKVPEDTDLIALGTRDIRYGGKYKPTAITVADFIDSIPVPPIGIQSIVAGTNVTVNNTNPLNPIVNSLPDGVQSIVAGTNVTINNTDPANPIINAIGGSGGSASGLQTAVFGTLFGLPTTAAVNCSPTVSWSSQEGMTYYPYIPNTTFTCTQFAITVNATQPTGLVRICVYSSNNGQPNNLLYSSADLNCSTTGSKTVISSFTFTQGTVYWLAIQANVGSINLQAMNNSALLQVSNLFGNPITSWVQVSLTYASGAPSVAGPNSYQTSGAPTIFMYK